MKVLVVDMTHGGTKIATEFSKITPHEVFAWDIYNSLGEQQKEDLHRNGVKLVDEHFLVENLNIKTNDADNLTIVAPIHCKLEHPVGMSHHEAVAILMKNRVNVPVIEVTGVKGKTSVVHMLREIFKDLNPLILSSLGVEVLKNGKWTVLKRDISITPASIMEAWEMSQRYEIGIFIVETSLGGTGLASVGILTNIVEDYNIAGGLRKASQAKAQIFNSNIVACDSDSSRKYYPDFKEKTNIFSINGKSNVKASEMVFGINETTFRVKVQGLETISGEVVDDVFKVSTFAPAPHHVENVLSAICASLTMGVSKKTIIKGLKNFKGLKGRTSLRMEGDILIIEEINPGINIATIKRAVNMLEHLPLSGVVFGGKYGVTCEEIDEKSASNLFNELAEDVRLVLTDELGAAVGERIKRNFDYVPDFNQAVDSARERGCQNILLIYRSNFPDLIHR